MISSQISDFGFMPDPEEPFRDPRLFLGSCTEPSTEPSPAPCSRGSFQLKHQIQQSPADALSLTGARAWGVVKSWPLCPKGVFAGGFWEHSYSSALCSLLSLLHAAEDCCCRLAYEGNHGHLSRGKGWGGTPSPAEPAGTVDFTPQLPCIWCLSCLFRFVYLELKAF